MNIVHIVDSLQVGGAETLIALLCRQHRMQGHRLSIGCLYAIGSIGERLEAEGFEVTLHEPPTFIGLIRSLYRSFKQGTPDVIHCHNATAAIIAAFPARMAGVETVVVTRHGLVNAPYMLARELKFALASRFCDWVVAVCDEARHNLIAAPFAIKSKIIRIYNGVPKVDSNRGGGVTKSGFTLLNVGRLSAVKDQESLVRAFALAKPHAPHLQLWIVGNGPLEAKLRRLTCDLGVDTATQFFGEQADVTTFYNSADLFVMSSRSEGLPMALLEAMSAGLPSIVTKIGGMAEIASLSCATFVVPVSNYQALAGAICQAAEDSSRLAQMGLAARQCYEQNFTVERMANEYIQLYRRS